MTRERFVRRNRVDEPAAIAIAAIAGLLAAAAGAHPTGQTIVDWSLVGVSVAAVVWAAASAPWWAPAGAAGVAAVIAFDPIIATVAVLAFGGGLYIGIRRRDQSIERGLVAAVAMNALVRSDLGGFLGLSALIGISVGVVLFVVGLRRRPSKLRRVGWIGVGVVGVIAAAGLVGTALAGLGARPDLTRATSEARQAIDAVNAGDYQGAADLFVSSSADFVAVDDRLSSVLTAPALLIPGVAQNVNVGADLSAAAARATSDAADALRSIDPARLRLSGGRIDIDAIGDVEAPLLQVRVALDELEAATAAAESPWLLGRIQTELDELNDEFASTRPKLETAIEAVRLAPQMLGADGTRRYLVLFTSPVEARGIAGFIGNYAQIDVTDGRIRVSEFGRRSELDDYVRENGARCDGCSPEVLDRYGDFGLDTGPDGGVIPTVWLNLPMPAHFPNTAETAQILYPQSGGEPVDGVISVDPYVIEALMQYTGPIEVPELDVTVSPDNAAEFILRDQYRLASTDSLDDIDNESRVDALQTLGEGVIEGILTGSLPEPSQIARDLGPLAAEHRVMMWTDDEAEQELLATTGLLGAMPDLGPDGGFSVVVANAGESKIDAYLERSTDVRIETGPDGERELVADVTLRNGAPRSGLPAYVIGNSFDLPPGTSRLIVNFFGPASLTSVTQDGEEVPVSPLPEAGWMGYSTLVTLASGETVDYTLRFALPSAPSTGGGTPAEWVQPLAIRDP